MSEAKMDSESRKSLSDALDRAGSFEDLMEEMARSEPDAFRDRKAAAERGPHPPGAQLYDYVLGSVNQPVAAKILAHISLCTECLVEVISLRRLEDELLDDDMEWAQAPKGVTSLIKWVKDLVSTKPLDCVMFNPAMVAASSLRGKPGLGAGPSATGFLSALIGVVSALLPARGRPRGKELEAGKESSFRIGDPLLFSVSIPSDGHLIVVHYNGADRLKLVFPVDATQETAVFTGETKRISGYVEGPVGLHFLKAIWTTGPMITPAELDFTDQNLVQKALEVCIYRTRQLDPEHWREVLCEFEVEEK
jgi:hypothetical protein